ncbi:hypothetical protein KAR91_16190 [Candidatus Pacearchaeota archaeon]|nr:hypothetical protein [Candidatus Pacearchaeota archaeon]
MAFINQNFVSQLITDTATVYITLLKNLESIFEGSLIFTVTGTKATGTFDVDAQLQGSNSADFSTGVINLGSPVALSDTVTGAVPLSGTVLYYAYYRVAITGADTQTTNVVGTVTMKGRN